MLLSATLFGLGTPIVKLLIGQSSPVLLAGLLYLGGGIGLLVIRVLRDKGWYWPFLRRSDWYWLLAAVFFGGLVAPVFLLYGLSHVTGSTASLLLNLEMVLTAVIAWLVFKENAGTRILLGMLFIVAGSLILGWSNNVAKSGQLLSILAIVIACAGWAIDNNLTHKVSATDAIFIACCKDMIAGIFNTVLALSMGAAMPYTGNLLEVLTLGLFSYGCGLALFILALRNLGTARTSAYFSISPFVGVAFALSVLHEQATPAFWIACLLMVVGVWLHITEHHEHEHTHDALCHSHSHVHDEHHQHIHDFNWDGTEPHTHRHIHDEITHSHPHYPDIHHRHRH